MSLTPCNKCQHGDKVNVGYGQRFLLRLLSYMTSYIKENLLQETLAGFMRKKSMEK
jgi:hypothetical protein